MVKQKFKYFVLLANMRTGSNLFEENINLYESFSCFGELFNPNFVGFPNKEPIFDISVKERDRDPIKLIRKMVANSNEKIPGFRLFSDHDHRVLDYILEDHSCAKITLTRNPIDSFISFEIAKKTDQWKLTDLHKRKAATVNFDIANFKSYLNQLSKFKQHIKAKLQTTGQAAYHLNYNDLHDLDVFNGLTQFLGSEEKLDNLKEKIKRQNPEGLSEKVDNYEEMMEQVQSINLLSSGLPEFHEPDRHPGAKNFILGEAAPLLFQPISLIGQNEFSGWIQKQSENLDGGLLSNLNQKQIFNWLENNNSRVAFSYLAHPLERVNDSFVKYIVKSDDDSFPWIKKVLTDQYNIKLPTTELSDDLDITEIENSGYGIDDYRAALKKFVKFLNGNLKGQTRVRIDHAWASQSAILGGYTKVIHPDYLLRRDNYHEILLQIENQLGLPNIEVNKITLTNMLFPLTDLYDDELEELVRKAYSRDYLTLGFKNWA